MTKRLVIAVEDVVLDVVAHVLKVAEEEEMRVKGELGKAAEEIEKERVDDHLVGVLLDCPDLGLLLVLLSGWQVELLVINQFNLKVFFYLRNEHHVNHNVECQKDSVVKYVM